MGVMGLLEAAYVAIISWIVATGITWLALYVIGGVRGRPFKRRTIATTATVVTAFALLATALLV